MKRIVTRKPMLTQEAKESKNNFFCVENCPKVKWKTMENCKKYKTDSEKLILEFYIFSFFSVQFTTFVDFGCSFFKILTDIFQISGM